MDSWNDPQQASPQHPAGPPAAGAQQPYPAQPGNAYPPPGYAPPQQPGQPFQQAGPPPGYPQQPGYPPQQPGYPQPGQPQGHPVRSTALTEANWAAFAILCAGFVLTVVAIFLPWAFGLNLIDISGRAGGDDGGSFAVGFAQTYVHFLGYLAIVALPLAAIPWTLGAVKTQKGARWLAGVRSTGLSHNSFGWYRMVFLGRTAVMLVIHLVGLFCIIDAKPANIGVLQAGPWLLLAGVVIAMVGAGLGPKPGPGMPQKADKAKLFGI